MDTDLIFLYAYKRILNILIMSIVITFLNSNFVNILSKLELVRCQAPCLLTIPQMHAQFEEN